MGKKGLISVLLLATFMRFYNLYPWLIYGMDQEYQALIGKNIIEGRHFPLIGVNASDTGIYLGPFFSYFAAAVSALSFGNPIGGAVVASLLGVITTLMLYLAVKKMVDQRTALFSAILYAGSFLISFYDRQFWNPNPVPFFSVLIGFFLWHILKGNIRMLPWLAIAFGIGVQCHMSIFIFTPLILYILYRQRKKISTKSFGVAVGIYLIIQLPWIAFEVRHNFLNTQAIYTVLTGFTTGGESHALGTRVYQFVDTIGRVVWTPIFPDLYLESGQCKPLVHLRNTNALWGLSFLIILSVIVASLYIQRKQVGRELWTILIGILTTTGLYFLLYSRQSFEYYYLYLFPWLCVLLALGLRYLKLSWATALLIFFIAMNLVTLLSAKQSFSYEDKIRAMKWIKQELAGSAYRLEAIGGCGRFGGYRYLADHFVATPKSSYMDSYFAWLYPETIDDKSTAKIVLLDLRDPREGTENTPEWENYLKERQTDVLISENKFGNIRIAIYQPITYAYDAH